MKKNYLLFIPIIILFSLSIIYLPDSLKYKQLTWIIISFFILLIISKIKFKKILKYSSLYYLLSLLLLILVLVLNNFTNGSRGWINIGNISVQPSEIVKVTLILLSIKYYNKLSIYTILLIYIPVILLIFFEPDTGGVINVLIIMLYFIFKKANKKEKICLFTVIIICILILSYLLFINTNILIKIFGPSIFYRLDRINSFISGDNLQSNNALISIANHKLLYFPEMFNDFFISYILSKNIWMLIIILLSTNTLIFMLYKKNTLASQVAFYLITFQCFYNLLMNLKIVPIIGLPYLFLSYGGSHILSSMLIIYIVINKDSNYNKVLDSN